MLAAARTHLLAAGEPQQASCRIPKAAHNVDPAWFLTNHNVELAIGNIVEEDTHACKALERDNRSPFVINVGYVRSHAAASPSARALFVLPSSVLYPGPSLASERLGHWSGVAGTASCWRGKCATAVDVTAMVGYDFILAVLGGELAVPCTRNPL